MPSIVERIARVLCAAESQDPDQPIEDEAQGGRTKLSWQAFESRAVDVLEVMREPTEMMLEEGWEHSDTIGGAYTAMIETAMIEGRSRLT
jgi:hypothetical protein